MEKDGKTNAKMVHLKMDQKGCQNVFWAKHILVFFEMEIDSKKIQKDQPNRPLGLISNWNCHLYSPILFFFILIFNQDLGILF